MCIRDSYEMGADLKLAKVEDAKAKAFVEKAAALPKNVITCLLYTSDAADERSSVDLGGRRIINKKTLDSRMVEPWTK